MDDLAATLLSAFKEGKPDITDVARLMERQGGSFAQAIGVALAFADPYNQKKLVRAFPELIHPYCEQCQRRAERQGAEDV